MKIRKAKLKDVEQVAVYGVGLLKQHCGLDSYFAPAKDVKEVYRKFFKRCVFSKNRHLLVAEENGKIVGYALGELGSRPPVFKIRKIGFINDVFVAEEFRHHGIATQFLCELKRWFRSKNLEHIEISVHVENPLAKKVWEKYGFEEYMIKQRVEMAKFEV
jgi:ribosomal protein S18 acetylase RimI-like enzyme